MHRFAYRSLPGFRVVIFEGGLRAGVVELFKHVHDRVIDRIAGPLRVKNRIVFDRNGTGDLLCQRFVGIPARKRIAGAGRICRRKRDLCFVRHSHAGDIAAAVGVIGQLEVLARVVGRNLLAGSLVDFHLGGTLKDCVVEGLDSGNYRGVYDAIHMGGFGINLGITFAGKVLQHVDKVVLSGVRHILEEYGCLFGRVEVAGSNRLCRSLHIIGRMTCHFVFIGLGGGGSSNGVRKLVCLDLNDIGIENNLVTVFVEIVVLGSNLVDINGAELRDNGNALRDDRSSSYLGAGILNDPLLEHLSGHEGILRHRTNSLTLRAVKLGKLFGHGAIIIQNNKLNE